MQNEGFDILIPYHGNYKRLRELIGSISLYTRKMPYRITIIDDASENTDYFVKLALSKSIDGVYLKEQKGFGAALNAGIKQTKRPWVVMLHSDCRIEDIGWLSGLYRSLLSLKDQKVGFISARSDNPPGGNPLLQCPKEPRIDIGNQISDKPLPIFATLMPRKVIEEVGLFKEYPFGWYEDEEYFWRMKKKGYRQAVSGTAWVRHYGSETIKEIWRKNPSSKLIMENNRSLCLADLKELFGRPNV